MKKHMLALALAAAFTLPAHAHDFAAGEAPMQFNFELNLDDMLAVDDMLALNLDEMVAQADDEGAEARAKARAQAAEARERARAERERARAEGERARAEGESARAHAEEMAEWARNFSADFSNSVAYMFTDRSGRGRVVKGAPYSADIVTETKQSLADGNVITHHNVNKVWRDGEGRTRQETYHDDKLRSVYISDPVASMSYTLIPSSKVAISIPRIEMPKIHIDIPRVRIEMDKDGKMSSKEATSRNERVVVRTVDGDGVPGVREEVRVQVVRVGDEQPPPPPSAPGKHPVAPVPPVPPIPPIPPTPVIPGVHTLRFEGMGHLGKGDVKSLGTREVEGVKAEGRQTTWTIPAGQIGNEKPINVTSEQWYSPELQVTVYSRYNDPRTGESVYRLASLKRGEPQGDLFKVPEDYTVRGKGAKEKDKEKAKEKKRGEG